MGFISTEIFAKNCIHTIEHLKKRKRTSFMDQN